MVNFRMWVPVDLGGCSGVGSMVRGGRKVFKWIFKHPSNPRNWVKHACHSMPEGAFYAFRPRYSVGVAQWRGRGCKIPVLLTPLSHAIVWIV